MSETLSPALQICLAWIESVPIHSFGFDADMRMHLGFIEVLHDHPLMSGKLGTCR